MPSIIMVRTRNDELEELRVTELKDQMRRG